MCQELSWGDGNGPKDCGVDRFHGVWLVNGEVAVHIVE